MILNKRDKNKKKSFREFLLKESLFSGTTPSKKNLFRLSKKRVPNTSIEYSKTRENKDESSNITVKSKNTIQISFKGIKLFDNNEFSKEPQLPKVNNYTLTFNNNGQLFNSIDDYNIKRKINKRTFHSPKKTIFNSFDYNRIKTRKINFPRYIRLSEVFGKNTLNIFKFNSAKPSSQEKSVKLKLGYNKEYKDYINNKLKSNYNKDYNSLFIHQIKSDYMIDYIEKKNQIILLNAKQYEKENKNEELKIEERDKVDDRNLGKVKIFQRIRKYLVNQYHKYIIGKDIKQFFSNKENKINFLYDIYLLPNFKNSLIKQTYNSKKLENKNFVDHHTLRYLNVAKIILQKMYDKKLSLSQIELINEEINKERVDLSRIELDKNYTEKFDLFDIEDYLTKKKINQSRVEIFNEKTKSFFYNTFLKIHDKMALKNH